jgi:hypothetical protein
VRDIFTADQAKFLIENDYVDLVAVVGVYLLMKTGQTKFLQMSLLTDVIIVVATGLSVHGLLTITNALRERKRRRNRGTQDRHPFVFAHSFPWGHHVGSNDLLKKVNRLQYCWVKNRILVIIDSQITSPLQSSR